MRILGPLLYRKASREPVPFQEILPMKLRSQVSGKGDKTSEVCCIQEMAVMLACLKTNDFDQSLCPKEIQNFQNCYKNHMNTSRMMKEREEKGILTPGEKKLTHKQVNILLSKYPNFK